MENCVAETAFFVRSGSNYEIRWFTPEIEMDLCGHATLAAAHVITQHLNTSLSKVRFLSQSGDLVVVAKNGLLSLDFPRREPHTSSAPPEVLNSISEKPVEVLKSRDFILVFDSESTVKNINPDRKILDQINLDPGGVIVTAKGLEVDFVSRYFTPQASIFEDPVTGSAHCSLIPYWSQKLGRSSMVARQLSEREGKLFCEDLGDRVLISGRAITYLEGLITI